MSLCEAGRGIACEVSVEPSESSSSSSSSSSEHHPPPGAPVTPPISELAEDFKDPRPEAAVATPTAEAAVATPTVVGNKRKEATAQISRSANQVDPKPDVKIVAKAKFGWVAKAKARCDSFACN